MAFLVLFFSYLSARAFFVDLPAFCLKNTENTGITRLKLLFSAGIHLAVRPPEAQDEEHIRGLEWALPRWGPNIRRGAGQTSFQGRRLGHVCVPNTEHKG